MVIAHTIKRHIIVLIFALAFVAILSTEVRADLYNQFGIVENNSGIAGSIASQLSLNITDAGSNQVLFLFSNAGPLASSITDIYFEDGTLLGLATIFDKDVDPVVYAGVDFDQPVSPSSLPGGATLNPAFTATAAFSVDSASPIKVNGINPGESLGLLYTLQSGLTFSDAITAINTGFTSPDPSLYDNKGNLLHAGTTLRIGLHVQGVGQNGDYSDSFILTPIPPSVIIGILGLFVGILGLKLRKYA
jgi:hypothetical protein